MSDTNEHTEDDAPPDPAAPSAGDVIGHLGDALSPRLSTETTRSIAEQMNKAFGSIGHDYAATFSTRFDPSSIASEISASVQSSAAGIAEAVLNLGERTRSIDLTKMYQFDMPKMSELFEMPKLPEFPAPEGISEAARRLTESFHPYDGGGVRSDLAAAVLGSGLSELTAGLKLDLPPLRTSVSEFVLSQISGRELFGGRDAARVLGVDPGNFARADSAWLNLKSYGVQEWMGSQLAQYVPSGTISEAMRRWMPGESIAETFSAWRRLAGRGLPAAKVALSEALGLVAALQRNDDGVAERVKQFLITWLRFGEVSMDLVASAVLVLLNTARWLPTELYGFDPRKKLRSRILVEQRKASRLSTDSDLRFRGHRLRSLQDPIGEDEETGTVITLADRVADPRAVDPAGQLPDEFVDPWMRELWWKLTDRERTILRAKSQPRVTWAEAAVECGGTIAEGEALRRKVKRLSKLDLASQRPGRAVS